MYKTRLKRWGVTKNIRLPKQGRQGRQVDSEALLRLAEGSGPGSQDGQRTLQLGNGQLVDARRLEAYLRRRAYPSYNKRHGAAPAAVRPPDALHASESVVVLIRDFLRGRWEGTVRTAEDLDLLRETESPVTMGFVYFTSAVDDALGQGDVGRALREMRRAPAQLAGLLRRPPSAALSVLCRFLVLTARSVRPEPAEARLLLVAVRALLRYAVLFATSPEGLGLPAAHPLVGILRGFLSVDGDTVLPLALRGWRASCSTFDALLDHPGCVSSFSDWLNLTDGAGGVGDLPPDMGEMMEGAVGRYERRYGLASERTHKAMWFHASYLATADEVRGLGRFRNEKAFQINKEMLRRGVEGAARASAHAHVAKVYAERGDKASAEEHLWEAAQVLARVSGRRQNRFVTWLREWYTEWGEPEKLARLNRWCEEPQPEVLEVEG